jgi:ferrous iron transport protein A
MWWQSRGGRSQTRGKSRGHHFASLAHYGARSVRTLADLALQEQGVIEEVIGDPALVARLSGMGLLPETELRVSKKAPLGDPIAIDFAGQTLSLRLREARQIILQSR